MIEILKLLDRCFPKTIVEELGISMYEVRKQMKLAKQLGYTTIVGYGGSGCDCFLHEGNSYCDCGGNPSVGRYTKLTQLGKEYIASQTK